jgi:hypothetical protein
LKGWERQRKGEQERELGGFRKYAVFSQHGVWPGSV